MMSKLVWRRCGACSQLTLVPATANVCGQCGAPIHETPTDTHAAGEDSGDGWLQNPEHHTTPEGDAFRRSGFCLGHSADGPTSGVSRPHAKPHLMGLTPADDTIARRLLESVFPEGIDLP